MLIVTLLFSKLALFEFRIKGLSSIIIKLVTYGEKYCYYLNIIRKYNRRASSFKELK